MVDVLDNFDDPLIIHSDYGHSDAGYYVYESEYPEDGSVYLGTELEIVQ